MGEETQRQSGTRKATGGLKMTEYERREVEINTIIRAMVGIEPKKEAEKEPEEKPAKKKKASK